jgi:glutamyl-tRNA synthetase
MKDFFKEIRAYALKNALEHEGKSNSNSILNGLFSIGFEKKDIKKIMPEINSVLKEINSMGKEEQEKEYKKFEKFINERETRGNELPELKTKRKVIMRFSPSASGPLHIGHILTMGPNYLYVKRYGGKFYVRIEDTNPDNIYAKAYEMIEKESRWLCDEPIIIIQSDRIELYYKYVKKLLDTNAVYVCTCNSDEWKELIGKSKACPCRGMNDQKKRWEKMLKEYKEGKAVLRFKGDLKDKNPAFRDFPLARIKENKHHRQGKKYRVWPLMNLAVTVDDIEQGMTHIIRGKDQKDNAKRQEMIYKVLGKKYPWVGFIGRLHFTDLDVSTTKMREGIEQGKYSGWDDPKLPTVASLKKKGFNPETFWNFVIQRGISEADKTITQKDFYEILDKFSKLGKRKHI